MNKTFSQRVLEAIAADFIDDASEEQEEGITYRLEGSYTWIREQRPSQDEFMASPPIGTMVLRMGLETGIGMAYKLPIAEFVGGVAFALAESGDIAAETVQPQNIAGVCFALGRMSTKFTEGAVNG